jgi:uncharacterized membrane protein YqgA involved in biofilm formation
VIIGSTVGTFLRSRFPDRVRQMVMWGMGLISLVIGLQMSLTTKNILVVLGSLLVGGIIGELVRLHEGLNREGDILQAKLTTEKDSTFSKGFVTASLLFCVGPMTILGSIQDGLSGNYTLLATKSIQLNVLLPEELREIARKMLGLVRKVEQASHPYLFMRMPW